MCAMKHLVVFLMLAAAGAMGAETARRGVRLRVDPDAVAEILPLAVKAVDIFKRASAREARHAAELRKRGIAEVPPEGDERYVLDTAGLGEFAFDGRGEIYIDRRFVTDEEMKTVRAIEGWIVKWFPRQTEKHRMRPAAAGGAAVPVFRGFRSARYQKHDALIVRLTKEFNADKVGWCGGTPAQAAQIPDLTPAQVKAHMIEESGGNGPVSKAAWAADPLQVNVPGDWGEEKTPCARPSSTSRARASASRDVPPQSDPRARSTAGARRAGATTGGATARTATATTATNTPTRSCAARRTPTSSCPSRSSWPRPSNGLS